MDVVFVRKTPGGGGLAWPRSRSTCPLLLQLSPPPKSLLVRLTIHGELDQKNITALSGQKNVTLKCRAPNNNITVVEWSRDDLGEEEYVLLYRNKQFDPVNQNPSFKNRVDLQDTQMKDGDVSLILKDVTSADNGTYMCCIVMAGSTSCDPISIIYLRVVDPPGQTGGLTEDGGKEDGVNKRFGLVAFGLFILGLIVALVIATKLSNRNLSNHLPSDKPTDICSKSA
ncbi:uncharacterized protein LOC112844786 [Oreochromis niloticus]|uniref:uncharacterized protein LOC112844786 n=1 Tax=Oreochromis niloticus TaxID=8128 RepID=UPI000DF210C4|nr:uncharacterized protein LOC112844786 [Oreochromis niloticus]